jgi:hypothetical protein
MILEMFVNELSLSPSAIDIATGQNRVRQFVLTMREATARGVKRTLRVPEDFFAKPVCPGYYWKNWVQDNDVERELRQFFRSLATKKPFLEDQRDVEVVWREIDCFWDNQSALGLKAAYVSDGLALSMNSCREWDTHLIQCEIHELVEDGVECRTELIHHASSPRHIDEQTSWIEQRIRTVVKDGQTLWRFRSDFFPALDWCSAVQNSIADLTPLALPSIIRGLFSLNAYCAIWQNGSFDPRSLSCIVSPDSEATLKKYHEERTFLCPDGQHRLFSWHLKVGSWRIYFHPFPGPGRLLVGYVGKHLRTVKFH